MLGQGRDTCARLQSERSATTSLCPPQVLEYLSDWEFLFDNQTDEGVPTSFFKSNETGE